MGTFSLSELSEEVKSFSESSARTASDKIWASAGSLLVSMISVILLRKFWLLCTLTSMDEILLDFDVDLTFLSSIELPKILLILDLFLKIIPFFLGLISFLFKISSTPSEELVLLLQLILFFVFTESATDGGAISVPLARFSFEVNPFDVDFEITEGFLSVLDLFGRDSTLFAH